jgi:sugar (pentulose or hexulose) kinase
MTNIYLGMDLGTTNTKVLAIDETGKHLVTASNETVWHNYPGGRVEADPEEIFNICLQTTKDAIGKAAELLGDVKVAGLAITGMAESGVIVNAAGVSLANPVAWFDARGEKEMNDLGEAFKTEYQSKTGLVFKAESSLSTLLAMQSEGFDFSQPGITWLNLLEYVAFRLTGERAAEPSLASRTALFDQSTQQTWKRAQELLKFEDDFIPPMRNSGDSWGNVTADFQPELSGAVVSVAGHDHLVGTLGAGATKDDQIFNSTGTADVIFRSVPGYLSDQQRLDLTNMGVSAGRHVLEGATSCIGGSRGGLVLRRALDLLGARRGERLTEIDEAWTPDRPFKDVIDLTQEKSISNDLSIVLTGDAGPNELWAAALDYMTNENRKFLAGLDKVVGQHKSSVASGGWIKMKSVREAKRKVMADLVFSEIEEAGAIGAAYIASWASQNLGDSLVDHIKQRIEK